MNAVGKAVGLFSLLITLPLSAVSGAAQANKPVSSQPGGEHTETFQFRYLRPSTLMLRLMGGGGQGPAAATSTPVYLADGVRQVAVDDKERKLTVAGDPAAVEHFRRICEMLDTAPLRCHLRVAILRPLGFSKTPPRVVASRMVDAVNSETTSLSLSGDGRQFDVTLIPHFYGDGTVRIDSQLVLRHSAAYNATIARPETMISIRNGVSAATIVRPSTASRLITLTSAVDQKTSSPTAGKVSVDSSLPSGTTYALEATVIPVPK